MDSGNFVIHPEDKHKTTFNVPQGMYQWQVMPFGLQIAPAKCQLCKDQVFHPIRHLFVTYMDDILIFSKHSKKNLEHLTNFVELVDKHGLVFSFTKIELFKAYIGFLGIVISN